MMHLNKYVIHHYGPSRQSPALVLVFGQVIVSAGEAAITGSILQKSGASS